MLPISTGFPTPLHTYVQEQHEIQRVTQANKDVDKNDESYKTWVAYIDRQIRVFDTGLSQKDRDNIIERMDFVNKDVNWAKHWLHLHDKDEFYFERPDIDEKEYLE